jgi:uncharacterized membrane protein (UPF0127 family)
MNGLDLVRLVFVLFVAVACDGTNDSAATPTPPPPLVTIAQDSIRASVKVEIAATEAQRELGLMNRKSMDEDAGMLFTFPNDVNIGFWMKNTLIPLDIAYIDASGRVLEVHQAKPLDETVLYPKTPFRYALEVNQGWFERHGLGLGATVTLPSNLPPSQ